MTVIIPGRLAGMNEYTAAQRTNVHKGAMMKRDEQARVVLALRRARLPSLKTPITINYRFYEQHKRRDKDNISGFAHKVIQDALVETGALPNDGWSEVSGWTDSFYVDAKNPRIEVEIIEN